MNRRITTAKQAPATSRSLKLALCVVLSAGTLFSQPSPTRGQSLPASQPATTPAPATQPVPHRHAAGDLSDLEITDEAVGEIDLLNLEVPTVVTASRREQKITSVPYAISVITREDIRAAGARTVADAMRLAPGVDVAEMAYGITAVSPRGFHGITSNRTLVLVDGRQVYDSLFGGTLWASWPFQLENIERIEVIRGPGAVAWGANAANGVINIITRDPGEQEGLTLHSRAGSRGSHNEYVGYDLKVDKLRLRVSGGYEGSDGFNSGGILLRQLDDDFKSPQMELSGVYEAGPRDRISFSGGSSVVDGGFTPGLMQGFRLVNPGTQASFLLGKWEHKVAEDNVLKFTGYVNDFHAQASHVIDYRYQQLALQMSHTFKPADEHTVTWGIDTRLDLLDATNADPQLLSKGFVSTPTMGIYLQDEWRFAPKWALNLGGRIDYDSYGGFNPSARGALSYDVTDTSSIYGAVSRAYKLHPGASRFLDAPLASGLMHVDSDRDLNAVNVITYETGYRGRFFDRLDAGLNLFWTETHDEFVFSEPMLGPPGVLKSRIINDPSSSMYGVEMDAKLDVTSNFKLLGNYTFQRLDWRGPELTWGTETIAPPANKFMLGARYSPLEDLHLSAHMYYVDTTKSPNPGLPLIPKHVDSYLRLDLRAEKTFWKDRGFFAVGVRNLLDPQHFEGGSVFLNQAEVPRMVYAEIGLRLGK